MKFILLVIVRANAHTTSGPPVGVSTEKLEFDSKQEADEVHNQLSNRTTVEYCSISVLKIYPRTTA